MKITINEPAKTIHTYWYDINKDEYLDWCKKVNLSPKDEQSLIQYCEESQFPYDSDCEIQEYIETPFITNFAKILNEIL